MTDCEILLEYIKSTSTRDFVINIVISIIPIAISVIALFQTRKQTSLSNKQHLFDRRLDKYLLFKDLLNIYEKKKTSILNDEHLSTNADLYFPWLIKCKYLEKMCSAEDMPLPSAEHQIFLIKMELLEKSSIEASMIWKGKNGKCVSDFITVYKSMLISMEKQNNFLSGTDQDSMPRDEVKKLECTANKKAKFYKLNDNLKLLNDCYDKIINKKIEDKIIKSIKL